LRTYDETAQNAFMALEGHVDVDLAREIWAAALDARWNGVAKWFHGDVAAGNLLLIDGGLAAVIDFGTCGVGDPSCDLAVAWTLLTADGRQAFRERLSVSEAAWVRGRGWALWKTLAACAHDVRRPTRRVRMRGASSAKSALNTRPVAIRRHGWQQARRLVGVESARTPTSEATLRLRQVKDTCNAGSCPSIELIALL